MRYDAPNTMSGDTVYFDVQLDDDAPLVLTDHVDLLRQCMRISQKRAPFEIAAAVVLPRRLRMMWSLPAGGGGYSTRWHVIKTTFARHAACGDTRLWQPRFYDHLIRDQGDFDLHANLIMTSPVREGLVEKASDWPWSSLHHRALRSERVRPAPLSAAQIKVQLDAKLPAWLVARQGTAA